MSFLATCGIVAIVHELEFHGGGIFIHLSVEKWLSSTIFNRRMWHLTCGEYCAFSTFDQFFRLSAFLTFQLSWKSWKNIEFRNYSFGRNKPSGNHNMVLFSSEYQFVHLITSLSGTHPCLHSEAPEFCTWGEWMRTFLWWNCDNLYILHVWLNSSSHSLSAMCAETLRPCTGSVSHLL